MSSRRRTAPIHGSLPAHEGVRRVLVGLADSIDATWERAAVDGDLEDLHGFRIAVRQTRSILGACKGLIPVDVRTDGRSLLGTLSDLTGPPRDLDVIVDGWPTMTSGLDEGRRAALDPLRALLEERQVASHLRLSAALADEALRGTVDDWRIRIAEPFAGVESGTTRKEIRRRVCRAHRNVARHGRAVENGLPHERLHALRKDAKQLRYLVEGFSDVTVLRHRTRYVRRLKRLQMTLGRIQDSVVQVEMFRDGAEELRRRGASIDTLLAIGSLTASIDAGRVDARVDFRARFGEFDRDSTRSARDGMFRRNP